MPKEIRQFVLFPVVNCFFLFIVMLTVPPFPTLKVQLLRRFSSLSELLERFCEKDRVSSAQEKALACDLLSLSHTGGLNYRLFLLLGVEWGLRGG